MGRMANTLVEQHGHNAAIQAAMRADAMLERDDLDGYATWRRILWAVRELQMAGPRPDIAVH